jgi:hypothetical protein
MSAARFEVLVRGRFVGVPEAEVRHVRANAWQVRVPRTPEIDRRLRGALDADEIVAGLDGVEAFQAVVSETRDDATILVLLLP